MDGVVSTRWWQRSRLSAVLGLLVLWVLPLVARPLRVASDDTYPPYIFRGSDGQLRGILPDQWRLWSQQTGRQVELVGMDWSEAIRRFEAGEFDVLDTAFRTPQRELRYSFSRPYARIDVPLFFDQSISGISGASDLGGLVVAAKQGDAALELLARSGVRNVVTYPSYERLIAAAASGQVRVFTADLPPAHYYLQRMGVADRFRESPPLYTGEFHRAVMRGQEALLHEVESGFARVSRAKLRGIDERWLGSPVTLGSLWRQYRYPLLGGLATLMALTVWLWSLRRTVSRQTAELRAEVAQRAAKEAALLDSEERLATIFNTVDEAIFIHDGAGRIVDVNQTVPELFGLTREQALSLDIYAFCSPDNALDTLPERWARVLDGEAARIDWICLRPGTDQVFPADVWLRRVTLDGQRLVLASVRDTTQRKAAEAAREALEAELAQAQKMEAIGRLAGGVAHDFNNLLTVILGHCDDLLDGLTVEDPRCESVDQIRVSAVRAADLTRQLLAFSRRQTLQPELLDLGLVVLDMERMLRRLIGEDVELVTQIGPALRGVVADRGQIERVVMNLAVNARDAMGSGGRLSLSVANVTLPHGLSTPHGGLPPGEYVALTVADTGCGMDLDTQRRVFEPFFTTKGQGQGTGLGLATVLGIVQQSGGHIVCHSQPNSGTRFAIYLPPAQGEAQVGALLTPTREPLLGRGERVLLVEDDEAVRRLTERQLVRLGFDVTAVADGARALAAVDDLGPQIDLVLSDVVMPGMNGIALIGELARRRPGLRFLLMSGYTDEAIGRHGVLDPSIPFLPKPFGSADLLAKVRAVLDAEPPQIGLSGAESGGLPAV